MGIPLQTPGLLYKSGVYGGYSLHGHVFLMQYQLLPQSESFYLSRSVFRYLVRFSSTTFISGSPFILVYHISVSLVHHENIHLVSTRESKV